MSGDWSDLADMMKNGRIEIKSSGEKPEPWRFDVPEVPDSVTCLQGGITGRQFVRAAAPRGFDSWPGSWWACVLPNGLLGPVAHITDIACYAPLVECPRPASRLVTARNTRRAPSTPTSDMSSERTEKPGVGPSATTIAPWEPPSEADRARVRDGLERNGAVDLAEMLGLTPPAPVVGPLTLTCPTCAAPVGVRCHTTGTRARLPDGHHAARRDAA